MVYPFIIQGGMGIGVSHWRLAKTVSMTGQLGVVSGVALDTILIRRLQQGDPGEHYRRALEAFPFPHVTERILAEYYIPNGKAAEQPFKRIPIFFLNPTKEQLELNVLANFAEIYLAKENHSGLVGVNYLEKMQLTNLSALYGAMLAGVDYILMGAGIPKDIPRVLDLYADHQEASLRVSVYGAAGDTDHRIYFDPQVIFGPQKTPLKRPIFLAIISSTTLAISLARKASDKVDGFIIEGNVAGGHNAPPRGKMELNYRGEPIYGVKDEVDLAKIREMKLPFWLAGSYETHGQIQYAIEQGAKGVQIGTPFAFCKESAIRDDIKEAVIQTILNGMTDVFTDPNASPTGFPFKILRLEGTLSEAAVYTERQRICDLGYLRSTIQTNVDKIEYRCPAEPVKNFVRKNGCEEDTKGRICLCNGLLANVGLAQTQSNGYTEVPLITAGESVVDVKRFIKPGNTSFSALDVIEQLTAKMVAV